MYGTRKWNFSCTACRMNLLRDHASGLRCSPCHSRPALLRVALGATLAREAADRGQGLNLDGTIRGSWNGCVQLSVEGRANWSDLIGGFRKLTSFWLRSMFLEWGFGGGSCRPDASPDQERQEQEQHLRTGNRVTLTTTPHHPSNSVRRNRTQEDTETFRLAWCSKQATECKCTASASTCHRSLLLMSAYARCKGWKPRAMDHAKNVEHGIDQGKVGGE